MTMHRRHELAHPMISVAICLSLLACGQKPPPPRPAVQPAAAPVRRVESEPLPETASPENAPPDATAGRGMSQALRRAPACSYLTVAEVSDILQGPIGTPAEKETEGSSSCGYPPLDMSSYQQAQIDIQWRAGGTSTFEDTLANAVGGSAVGRQVAHGVRLGDASSYSREGVMRIHAGPALISITLLMRPDSEPKAVALGTLLLQRLGYNTRDPATG